VSNVQKRAAAEAGSREAAVVVDNGMRMVSASDDESGSGVGELSEVEKLKAQVDELKAEREKMKARWEAERTILMEEIERRTK